MLEVLCGNKSIEKILIFLFVNGKCYGTQLHRALQTPLTPLQKALNRLEKSGVILSYFEGKTRLYHFNPSFPLLTELEQLLKKAYTLLSAFEKKQYHVSKQEVDLKNKLEVLLLFWDKLSLVRQLSFHAKTKTERSGRGKGAVEITKAGSGVLIFTEKGSWQQEEGKEFSFSNIFRFSLDRHAAMISLEHLRRGPDNPVFLFHLTPSHSRLLVSLESHLCESDTYFGQLHLNEAHLRLNWRVIGPQKNEEIDYYYS